MGLALALGVRELAREVAPLVGMEGVLYFSLRTLGGSSVWHFVCWRAPCIARFFEQCGASERWSEISEIFIDKHIKEGRRFLSF